MSYLTYIFPIAAALGVIYMAWRWTPSSPTPLRTRLNPRPDRMKAPGRRPRRAAAPGSASRSRRGASRGRDALLALAITLVYAAVAFTGLGNMSSPQSFCKFTERGRYVDIALPEETEITKIRYFCGLHTGEYAVQFSMDGENWTDAGTLEQGYTEIFKWMDSTEEGFTPAARAMCG